MPVHPRQLRLVAAPRDVCGVEQTKVHPSQRAGGEGERGGGEGRGEGERGEMERAGTHR